MAGQYGYHLELYTKLQFTENWRGNWKVLKIVICILHFLSAFFLFFIFEWPSKGKKQAHRIQTLLDIMRYTVMTSFLVTLATNYHETYQNLHQGWTISFWKRQVLTKNFLGKKIVKTSREWHPVTPQVYPRFKVYRSVFLTRPRCHLSRTVLISWEPPCTRRHWEAVSGTRRIRFTALKMHSAGITRLSIAETLFNLPRTSLNWRDQSTT